jgi:GT2 family glycosyltransferase
VGAAVADGRYLFFTDSDCQLHPDTLQQAADVLTADPQLDALIGAYDDAPAAPNFLSQYQNLLHHYIHHTSQSQASTFWTGCGAIKRTTFQQLGGFDAQRYPRPAIEDIELGYRLSAQGGSICLAPQVQVKHMKQWRWHTLLRSDILGRAWPWAQLLREKGEITADLNLQWSHRLSALCVYLLLFSLMAAPVIPFMLVSAVFFIVILLLLNQRLYRFFYHSRSWDFMVKAIPWHWCYYFYSSLVFFFVLVLPKRFFAG